uniref:Uncharacterized protein n=1 Tax=Strigamia maritima TaxID=126957 RepID=T1INJ0_STRMM
MSLTSTPLSLAACSITGSMGSPTRRQRNAEPLNGFSGYQCPSNLYFNALSSSSPKRFTLLLGMCIVVMAVFTKVEADQIKQLASSQSIYNIQGSTNK